MRALKELYELLWEQIKDRTIGLIISEIWIMESKLIITSIEGSRLGEDVIMKMSQGTSSSDKKKHFVQRRIKELT